MYYVEKHGFPYGMMVTASHNPAIYNGIKVFTAGGRDADETQTREIEGYAAGLELPIKELEYDKAKEQGLIREIYPLNEYLDDLMETINMEVIRGSGLRVVLDPMYGVSETSLRTLLQTARCEVEVIHDRHDTLFGGRLPAPSAATLRMLQTCVTDGHYDIGPRQMLLAGMVYTMFGLLFLNAIHGNGQPGVTFLLQFYCITVLYLQNTLFRKSSIQKELDMIQLLLYQQFFQKKFADFRIPHNLTKHKVILQR